MPFQLHAQLQKDSFTLGRFDLCQLLLINDNQYPWFVLVPQVTDIKEIYQLDASQQQALWLESAKLSQVLMNVYHGDKLNVAALGNMVPQLHLHHIVRFQSDPSWPKPIWGELPMQAYQATEVKKIQQKMAANLLGFKVQPLE